jgi:uncharacterized membrane protein
LTRIVGRDPIRICWSRTRRTLMISEGAYRRRLESDLDRWQREQVIAPAAANAIRTSLGPAPAGVNVATVVGLAGGLLLAAAFLALVAANWAAIPRPARFVILLAGIAGAYGLAAWFDRAGRSLLADGAVSAGCIVFGAAIGLTGQMYHLDGDFAGALLLWAAAALVAAAFTGSRGAFAVALVAACAWSGFRADAEGEAPHFAFVAFWLIAVALPLLWNSAVARHLAAVALLAWLLLTGLGLLDRFSLADPAFAVAAGAALMLGAGLLLAVIGPASLRAFGLTLSIYGALAFALTVAGNLLGLDVHAVRYAPGWQVGCGTTGLIAALGAAARGRAPRAALAALAICRGHVVRGGGAQPPAGRAPFMIYALSLVAMLSLVASGMLDDVRPRIVAGWIGLACVIAAITWAVGGSLLERAAFLAAAGVVAIVFAGLLGRLRPQGSTA